MNLYRRAAKVLGLSFVAYALLVATNLGEFWPFSIYPMFSQGGIPWSRSVVRQVETDPDSLQWQSVRAADLPGEPYALLEYGISPIDLANFVSKSRVWNANRVDGLRRMFGEDELDRRSLLVMRVNGRIAADDSVQVSFVPYVFLGADTSHLNPELINQAVE